MSGIFYQIDRLGSALGATERNHRVVSQNIANVNTPGYKTKRLEFDAMLEQLQNADGQPPPEELPLVDAEGLAARADGNNVHLEKEVGELKKNAMIFQTYSQLLASRLATMRRAISG